MGNQPPSLCKMRKDKRLFRDGKYTYKLLICGSGEVLFYCKKECDIVYSYMKV